MATLTDSRDARAAYDAFAPFYDDFTAHHDYELWTGTLEALARQWGLRGNRLLDVACGTGKSFLPFLARGWEVTACDLSPEMLARAATKAGGAVELAVHDMRTLPALGSFDLVLCLDDAVNYLHDASELTSTLEGLRRNLAPGGVAVFDANTVHAYRSFFASISVVPRRDQVLVWEGQTSQEFEPGGMAAATLTALTLGPDGTWSRAVSEHRQRHHPIAAVVAAIERAGLECVATYGMSLDGSFSPDVDEHRNSKAVYIARERAGR
jgi:SAM-dependent methyltransferase